MEESMRVRKAAEPLQLVKLVSKIKEEFAREERSIKLSRPLKLKLADEVLQMLKGLKENKTVNEQREALENWRRNKLKETEELERGTTRSNSSMSNKEAKILRVALKSNWDALLEHIGVWMPAEVINKEPDDQPESDEDLEDQIIPGRPLPPECNVEPRTDYGGAAVKWGLTYHRESAADCCQACLDQAKSAKPGQMKCNIWVYCPSETGCFSPDIYEHKHQECWLKQADQPKPNYKDKYADWFRNAHPTAPLIVPWVAGVVSA
ncbi:dimethylallyl, adenosine tRNA methylthiotransferase [Thalictrum thalictroides]|uniref:Dimethylallyl, adenosine tRNA methylthiotransferase n=1 Tax=Thalictrum thalictroides TaxID=46969 RepID=A0A7J6VYK9_THATH|nr:dimethylallyl, adenosine tRNA methylthiotransferase [Thalictrum thalictroides]